MQRNISMKEDLKAILPSDFSESITLNIDCKLNIISLKIESASYIITPSNVETVSLQKIVKDIEEKYGRFRIVLKSMPVSFYYNCERDIVMIIAELGWVYRVELYKNREEDTLSPMI